MQLGRVIDAPGQLIGEIGHQGRRRKPAQGFLMAALRPRDITGHVHGHAEQPGPERRTVRLHPVFLPPGFQERERDHLLGGRPVSRQPVGQVIDGVGAFVEERAESVRIASAYARPQVLLHIPPCPLLPAGFRHLIVQRG